MFDGWSVAASFGPRLRELLVGNLWYTFLGGVTLGFAVWSLIAAYRSERLKRGGDLTPFGIFVLLFWTLGPPLYFFLEDQLVQPNQRGDLKATRELASQIWAAVLAALLFKLSK